MMLATCRFIHVPELRLGVVLEQLDHGVRPVGDVVERLLVADDGEPRDQLVELVLRERTARIGPGGELAGIRLVLADHGELGDDADVPGAAGKLVKQLVHADVTFRCQRRDRLREVLGVVILHGRTLLRRHRRSRASGCGDAYGSEKKSISSWLTRSASS
jgi:hypothetical protein